MPRWTDVSAEPNSPESKRFRRDTLRNAYKPPVVDRIAYLQNLAASKRVLDVGVVEHTLGKAAQPHWLHGAIAQSAAYCLGVDILPEPVMKLQAAGYNVRLADITRDEVHEKFDVIVVGEVIEHLGSPEKLFESALRLLSPAGQLVITSPNPYYWKRQRNATLKFYRRKMESVDHVSLMYPSAIAELAERAGLHLEQFRGVHNHRKRPLIGPPLLLLEKILAATILQPEIFCETMIYECRRP